MSDPFEDELKALFDVVESPEEHIAESSPDCEEIKSISQRYDKEELVGQGGVKKVWAASDKFSKRVVAYAEPRDGIHPIFYDLLLEEAWLTSSLQHSNIIKVHDVGVDTENRPFFTMDFKQGQNLAVWRAEQKEVDVNQYLDIFVKICEAIEHAHSKGIVHLDLKPENIQLESFSEVVVCDWGLGRRINDSLSASAKEVAELSEIADSTIGGTPGFMAPEQINKEENLSLTTDIYGLGALLYFLLSGKRCVEGDSAKELLQKTVKGSIRSVKERFPGLNIPRALDEITLKCLEFKPENRYQRVKNLIDDIRAYQRDQPTSLQKENKLWCLFLLYKRQNLLCNLGFLAILVLGVALWWFTQKIQLEVKQRQLQEKRADKAEEKVDLAAEEIKRITDEIFKMKDESETTRKAKADELNDIVATIKAKTMYLKTVEAVNAMESLSKLSLTLDNTHMAWHQIAEVHFIQMNTAKTKEILKHYTPEAPELLKVFELCPEAYFSDKVRPSKKELMSFIESLLYNIHGHILAQRVILYDYELRKRKMKVGDYAPVVKSYFMSGSKAFDSFSFELDKERKTLVLNGVSPDQEIPPPRLFLTSCLDLNKLVLKGNFCNLTGLDRANITVLDISEHSPMSITSNNVLNHETLEKVIVKKGVYDDRTLAKMKAQYEVIELP